jgi:fucose permease
MVSVLLVVIYVAFISLGLPDAALGSAWPSMFGALNVPVSYAGLVSMVIAGGTILSSLFSVKVIRRLGTGLVTMISVALTAAALIGFSISSAFWQLCLWAIPYGLGAGSVDAALNNFVALHYKSRHMNWLHCFWGVGAALGPYIMGFCLTGGLGWHAGYRSIGVIQVVLVAGLIFSLPLWKVKKAESGDENLSAENRGMLEMIRLPGAGYVLIAFFSYCAMEVTAGLWASSYMVLGRGVPEETAASMASLFYLGITLGRFLSGFISGRLGDRRMVRLGQWIMILGIALIMLPTGSLTMFAGLLIAGLGCAPVFPGLLHETPDNFGKENSQAVIGMQMASAYTGATLTPMVFGFLAERIDIALYPYFLLAFAILMAVMVERVNRTNAAKQSAVSAKPQTAVEGE